MTPEEEINVLEKLKHSALERHSFQDAADYRMIQKRLMGELYEDYIPREPPSGIFIDTDALPQIQGIIADYIPGLIEKYGSPTNNT